MNEPKRIVVLFDRLNHTIGLKPATDLTKNAYPISPRGMHGGKKIRAQRIFQEFGIRVPQTIRFEHPWVDEDGVLNLDLRTVTPSGKLTRPTLISGCVPIVTVSPRRG